MAWCLVKHRDNFKSEGKIPLERSRRSWQESITMDLKGI
jgi:hypothetical protein